MGGVIAGACGPRNVEGQVVVRADVEPLPELDAWVNHSARADLPAVVEDTHRVSSHEACSTLLGTDLLEASAEGNLPAVKQLLAGGAPRDARDANGRTPLHLASMAGHASVAAFLILHGDGDGDGDGGSGGEVSSLDSNSSPAAGGLTPPPPPPPPLRWKPSNAGPILVAPPLPLRKQVIIDARDTSRSSPLHLAAAYGHANVVRLLISHGADIFSADGQRKTPLHAAATAPAAAAPTAASVTAAGVEGSGGGGEDSLRILLEAGGDAMARDRAGRTPLHAAASFGSATAVSILLVEGRADVEARGRISGRTALHEACVNLRPEAVKRLLDHGAANELALDADGRMPRDMVGEGVAEEERMLDPKSVLGLEESVRRMLDGAQSDRLWRRRRLLPLLRWRQQPPPAYHERAAPVSAAPGARSEAPSFVENLADLHEDVMRTIVSYL